VVEGLWADEGLKVEVEVALVDEAALAGHTVLVALVVGLMLAVPEG
jgi:hypothetical protein